MRTLHRYRAFWFALTLCLCCPLALAAEEGAKDKVLQGAVDKGLEEAKGRLDPATLVVSRGSQITPEKFFAERGLEVPVLMDRLETPMRRFGLKVIIGTWTFYTSAWWQWTIRSLLVLAALIGLYSRVIAIADGMANPAHTWRTVMFRFGITGAIIASIAPNAPFVMTKAINQMAGAVRLGASDGSIVRYHQQAFFRRAMLIEAKTAIVLDGRFEKQFYEGPLTYPFAYNGSKEAVPNYLAPLAKLPKPVRGNDEGRQVTPLSFLFVSPPKLGPGSQIELTEGRGLYFLYAPPAVDGSPMVEIAKTEIMAPPPVFYPAGQMLAAASVQPANTHQFADPLNSGRQIYIPVRPFGAAVCKVLEMYKQLYENWDTYRAQKKHNQTLDAVDAVARKVLEAATNTLADDVLENQVFALKPTFSASAARRLTAMDENSAFDPYTEIKEAPVEDAEKKYRDLQLFYERIGNSLADDFSAIKDSQLSEWTYSRIIPMGLLFCNAYVVIMIWLLPPLLALWGVFFLLPDWFDLSNALKKGAAGIVALALYPMLLQLVLVVCFAFADAANALDEEFDPNRSFAKMAIYGLLPSSSIAGNLQVETAVGKTMVVKSLAESLEASNAGIGTLIAWIVILLVLIGSPGIIAKFILGMGAADAVTGPAQTGATMGTMIGARAVGSGAGAGAGDIAATGTLLSRHIRR